MDSKQKGLIAVLSVVILVALVFVVIGIKSCSAKAKPPTALEQDTTPTPAEQAAMTQEQKDARAAENAAKSEAYQQGKR